MSDYTRTNLKQVEDATGGSRGDMEARFGRKHIDSEHLGVSYFRYGPDHRPARGHRHKVQEEAYVIVSGSGQMRLDDEIIDVGQWDLIRVAAHVVRAFRSGPDGLEVIAVGSDRPEDGDGELVEEFWTE